MLTNVCSRRTGTKSRLPTRSIRACSSGFRAISEAGSGRVERLAPAKINLALHLLGRRPDGYHELDTIAVFADIGDKLAVSSADELTLSISGPFAAHAPKDENNLVLRAARLLREHARVSAGAAIELEKNLPAGAGFGGGSSDAAATLSALNELWALRIGAEALAELGQKLGADVPMCLQGRALRARGTGERIAPIANWPTLLLVLVWPAKSLSTAAVFDALTRRDGAALPEPPAGPTIVEAAQWLVNCRNDLEQPAIRLAPEVGEALAAPRASDGCLLARMSGSGSGCFGLYVSRGEAEAAAKALQNLRPDWWVAACEAR